GIYWANHSWLFDLGLYAGHQALGDPMLVFLKAIAVLLLAALMFRVARSDGPFWISAGCMLLAILAMYPRLLLQPALVSLLFLGACLVLLGSGGRAYYFLPAAIALWVNVDSWFILGPLLVFLYLLGERLGSRSASIRPAPWWLLPVSLAACLVG